MARAVTAEGEVGMFWTCAVYYNLYRLFFENPDTLPFFIQFVMNLDEMQLAVNSGAVGAPVLEGGADSAEEIQLSAELAANPKLFEGMVASKFSEGKIPEWWRIAFHPSPTPLVQGALRANRIVGVTSNARAAYLCAAGEVEACITTEVARRLHELVKIHSFGSPSMVFFGGITSHGVEVIKTVYL